MGRIALAFAVAGLAACVTPTSFVGASKVPNGPAGCKAVCEGWGMVLAGMVQMGEYSDGCICQVRKDAAAAPAAGAASPASAGVYMQMMAAAAQQQRMQQGMQQQGLQQHPYIPHSPVGSPGWRPGMP
jgi:hypothetical protein